MSKLKYIKWNDILALAQFLIVLPFALITKIFYRNLWLVCEDKNEARDNGYWLFKYIRENQPKQKVMYAINKKSVDYDKVKSLGKVIAFGGWAHWFWYIVSDKKISSQKGGKPNAAVCYLLEVACPIWKNKRYFLQHGVTINDSKWLYYEVTKFRMFVTSTLEETADIKANYGYPDGAVQCLGFPRFDKLHNISVDKDTILVMPTWREWLARPTKDSDNIDDMNDFANTEYCVKWNEFLNSPELDAMLTRYGKKILFYPHRNMQKFIRFFHTESDNIVIADANKYDIQDVLKSSALMITDYSSVFFDFAYMRKPILFYQFDEEKFRKYQYGQGYFDYRDNVLSKFADNMIDLLSLLEEQIKADFELSENAKEAIFGYFPYHDTDNCKRNYEAILKS